MGFDIGVRDEEVFLNEDRSWLGTRLGADQCRSITIDPTLFLPAHIAEKGALPSGLVLAESVANPGIYGPYDNGNADLAVAAGLLFSTTVVDLDADFPVGVALFWLGVVKQSKLPAFAGTAAGEIDAGGRADLPMIRWEA